MKKLLPAVLLGALSSLACTGLTGSTVTVNLSGADGLEAGQPVQLNGLQIGEVKSVAFQEGSDAITAQLSISDEGLARLDPETLFVVIRRQNDVPNRIVVASNLCVSTPQGLADGAVLDGYAGPLPRVVLQASQERPQCAQALITQLLSDLQGAIKGDGAAQ